jgi:hypothetical protein
MAMKTKVLKQKRVTLMTLDHNNKFDSILTGMIE